MFKRIEPTKQLAEKGIMSSAFIVGYNDDIPVIAVEAYDRVITDKIEDEIYTRCEKMFKEFNFEVYR